MSSLTLSFVASLDVAATLNALLDIYERRDLPLPREAARGAGGEAHRRTIRCDVHSMALPGYHSQLDPNPRLVANEQLAALENLGYVRLAWLQGEERHLLESVTLVPERADELFAWLNRVPVAALRARLRDLLLAERFRFGDWRLRAVEWTPAKLKYAMSPAPFSLTDDDFN